LPINQIVVILHTLFLGYAKVFLTMFIKKIHNRSGSVSVIVAEKNKGKYTKLATIGIARDESEVDELMDRGRRWIAERQERLHPTLDFDGRAEAAKELERQGG
jgi:hypothetical protein